MPHLSPASWIIMPIIFWSVLATIMSVLWWHQIPSLPHLHKPRTLKQYSWQWSW